MIDEGASLGNELPLTRKTLEVFDQASLGGIGGGIGAADAVMMTMRAMMSVRKPNGTAEAISSP